MSILMMMSMNVMIYWRHIQGMPSPVAWQQEVAVWSKAYCWYPCLMVSPWLTSPGYQTCNILIKQVGYSDRDIHVHDDVIKWKQFLRYWPFVRGIHRSPVNSPHKGHWRRTLMFSLICAWTNGWVNNRYADDLRRHRPHCDVILW